MLPVRTTRTVSSEVFTQASQRAKTFLDASLDPNSNLGSRVSNGADGASSNIPKQPDTRTDCIARFLLDVGNGRHQSEKRKWPAATTSGLRAGRWRRHTEEGYVLLGLQTRLKRYFRGR